MSRQNFKRLGKQNAIHQKCLLFDMHTTPSIRLQCTQLPSLPLQYNIPVLTGPTVHNYRSRPMPCIECTYNTQLQDCTSKPLAPSCSILLNDETCNAIHGGSGAQYCHDKHGEKAAQIFAHRKPSSPQTTF